MTPAELRSAGEALYGARWQTALARELPVDPSTVRRWLSGRITIPQSRAQSIRWLLQVRCATPPAKP